VWTELLVIFYLFIGMKYFYDENAFNDNTEEMYYYLGFISADGCLKKTGEIAININIKDVKLLEEFKKYLNTEKPIYYQNKTNSVLFSFGNKKIYNNIIKFGLTPKKSLTLKFPKNIPKNMLKHYIRGYFDGDGSISIINRKTILGLKINIVGTFEFLNTLQNHLSIFLGIVPKKILQIGESKNTFQLNYKSKNDILKIRDFLYNDSNIFLKRKFEIFQTEIINKKEIAGLSKYKNICFRKKTQTWSVLFYENNKRKEKSGFKTEMDAYDFLKKKTG
jgi:hypothetical protein